MAKAKSKKVTIQDVIIPIEEKPYEIPENWCWTFLSSVAEWGAGGTPSRKNPDYYEGDIPWIKTGELDDGYIFDSEEKITEEAVAHSSAKLFPVGSVLVAMYGATIGKTAILGIPATTNQACASARCNDTLDNKYLFYYLRSQKDSFIAKGKGGAQPNISQDIIKSHPIPLPPLAEQQRIVEQIETLFLKLDEAKDNSCEVVDKTRLRKSAILQAAFDGSLTKKWRSDNGIKMGSWKTKKIGDIVKPVKDKYDPTKDEMLDIPYIGLEHMEKSGGIIGSGSPEEVKSTKTLFSKGDILYGKLRPYLDKHDVVDFDGMCSTDILVYRAENESTARYINYLLGTIDFMDYAVENSSGINLPRTSEKIVSAYEVEFPTVEEQDAICNILDSMLQRENEIIDVAEDFIERVDLMKKSILAKAFRGELGTNNPKEESAIELLKGVLEA